MTVSEKRFRAFIDAAEDSGREFLPVEVAMLKDALDELKVNAQLLAACEAMRKSLGDYLDGEDIVYVGAHQARTMLDAAIAAAKGEGKP